MIDSVQSACFILNIDIHAYIEHVNVYLLI
jgi:hypothetical protein